MLGLAEYIAQGVELHALADRTEDDIARLTARRAPQQAIDAALIRIDQYYDEYDHFLESSLLEIGENAADYYEQRTKLQRTEDMVKHIVKNQYRNKYYGATLGTRLAFNRAQAKQSARKAAQVKPEHLSGVLTQPYPFGARMSIDKRLLQATSIKVEQDIAKEFAKQSDIPLMKWNLSGRHSQTDICDDLANNIDRRVVSYIQDNDLKIAPKGVYFRDELPQPPHPNCQCEFGLTSRSKGVAVGRATRAVSKVRNLLRRIRRR